MQEDKGARKRLIVEGTDDPEGLSCYRTYLKLNAEFFAAKNLESLDLKTVREAMDNVPSLCENRSFKQIIWEEFHEKESLKDRLVRQSPLMRENAIPLSRQNLKTPIIEREEIRECEDSVS